MAYANRNKAPKKSLEYAIELNPMYRLLTEFFGDYIYFVEKIDTQLNNAIIKLSIVY